MILKHRLQEETAAGDPGQAASATNDGIAATTALQGDQVTIATEPQKTEVTGVWPENWRDLAAGKDEKKLARLSRYASPQAAIDAMVAAQNKISSGEFRSVTPFPEKGTPEEQNLWRAANGIPESPDKYDIKLPEGVVIGENDKPIIEDFAKFAHAKNLPNEAVTAAVEWYKDLEERTVEQRAEKDAQIKQEGEDALRGEWGADFRRNVNTINSLLDQAPEGIKEKFLGGRMADGTPIGSDPDMLRYLASLALQINPHTTLVPGAGANVASAIEDELTKLEVLMGNRSSEYWKGPTSDKNQQRYRELVAARDKMKA